MTKYPDQSSETNSTVEQFITLICAGLSCSKEEKQSIKLELQDHLYTVITQYRFDGKTEAEAAVLAIAQFGDGQKLIYDYQRTLSPIYGVIRAILTIMFILYSIFIIVKLVAGRLLQRILEYINHDGPYYLSYVTTNARLLEGKQFFNFNMWEHNINFIPFDTILFYLTTTRVNQSIIVDNLLGNSIIFLPLGFLLPLIVKKAMNINRLLLIGVTISLSIELLQFTVQIGRADIDDVILNSIGLIIGFLCSKLFAWGITYYRMMIIGKPTQL